MIAVDSGDAAMAMAHVFAKTNIGDRDDFGTFLLNCAQRFLNDAVLGIRAARLFVFFIRDSKKQNGLEPGVLRPLRLIDDFVGRELKNAGHARNRALFVDFVADEKRQNEIVGVQIGFANEIS